MSNHRSKREVLRLMTRVGLGDRTGDADALLPEVIDLDSEKHLDLLAQVGLGPVDDLRDRLGGSP